MLKLKDVAIAHVPQIKGLRVNQILDETRKHINIDIFMPDLKYDELLSRVYFVKVGIDLTLILLIVNTSLPDELQGMVERVKAERVEKYNK